MDDMCGDNRYEIIEAAKKDILSKTNIETSHAEMAVLGSFLFRCWQMGWLEKYNTKNNKENNKEDDRWHY